MRLGMRWRWSGKVGHDAYPGCCTVSSLENMKASQNSVEVAEISLQREQGGM